MNKIFFFFLCLKFSLSGNYAIDFGSYFVKSSFTQLNEVPSILLNSQSKRSTPAFVAFHAKPQFNISDLSPLAEDETEFLTPEIGEKAQSLIKSKPWLGSGFFTSLVGLDDQELNEMSHLLFVNSTPARLSINDLIPLFFKKYLSMIASKKAITNLALIFPSSFTLNQRSLFEESLNICGFDNSKINLTFIDDVDAIIHIYATEKSFKFQKKDKNVLFLDVGAASIKGYVVNFQSKTLNGTKSTIATRLSYAIDHKNGGSFITGMIVQSIKDKLNIKKTTKSENRRLFESSEKIKIELSKSNSSVVIVQDINGRDFDITLTREELESQILADATQSVIDVAKEATSKIEFDDIELIGGSSRIPLFDIALKKVFKNIQKVGHSLNPDDAIAIGGNYYLQQILNISKFKKVIINDKATFYSIDMIVNDEPISICKKNVGCVESINISGDVETISLVYSQENELQEGLSSNTQFYDLEMIKNGILKFKFAHRPTRIQSLMKCKNNKCNSAYCLLLNSPPISKDVVMLFIDPKIKKERILAAQNEVQDYAKLMLDEITKNTTIRLFSNHSQRLDMIRCIEKEKVSGKYENISLSMKHLKNLTNRIENIRKCMEPVYQRIEENTTFVFAIRDLYMALQSAERFLYELKLAKPTGIDKNAKKLIKEKFRKTEKWFNESIEMLKKIPPYMEKPLKSKEFTEKAVELSKEIEIFSKLIAESEKNDQNNIPEKNDQSHSSKLEYERAENELRKEVKKMKKTSFIYGPKKKAFPMKKHDDL